MDRKANANWQGNGKEGKGSLTTDSGVLDHTPYAFNTRFENVPGTNPEELIAAAHAGCFAMQLSFNLTGVGHPPVNLDTECIITFEDKAIAKSHIILKATVPDISEEEFSKQVKHAEENCPISKLLNTSISVAYTLNPS